MKKKEDFITYFAFCWKGFNMVFVILQLVARSSGKFQSAKKFLSFRREKPKAIVGSNDNEVNTLSGLGVPKHQS